MDKTFSKQHKKFVEDKKNLSLNISMKGRLLSVSGSGPLVDFATQNPEIFKPIYDLIMSKDEENDENIVYKTYRPCFLPKLTHNMYDKKEWNWKIARYNMKVYMRALGFGNGGEKNYGVKEDCPDGWPDSVSFENVVHCSHMTTEECNSAIESLLNHRNIDPKTHFMETPPTEFSDTTSKKKRKRRIPQTDEHVNEQVEDEREVIDDIQVQNNRPDGLNQEEHQAGEVGIDIQDQNIEQMFEQVTDNVAQNNNNQHYWEPTGRYYFDYYHHSWFPNPHHDQNQPPPQE